ncbi:MAG TPA: ModE family transcriptional regulator [Sphingomonas sp.]|nr:ModE family transcriptional regulator [Sphingomonas sp.]
MLKLKAQFFCGDEIAMGPGKAALMEAIIREGSISAAARAIGMSYRRAWLLVDAMNRCWAEPLVETAAGGARGGGARLSETGVTVLAQYRAMEAAIAKAAAAGERAMAALLRPDPIPPKA